MHFTLGVLAYRPAADCIVLMMHIANVWQLAKLWCGRNIGIGISVLICSGASSYKFGSYGQSALALLSEYSLCSIETVMTRSPHCTRGVRHMCYMRRTEATWMDIAM